MFSETSSNDSSSYQSPVSQPRSSPSSRHSGFDSESSSFVASLPSAYSVYSISTATASPGRTLKRPRPLESEATAALHWECDLAYAVVHTSDCPTCRTYKSHVSDAKTSPDQSASLEQAIAQRDKQLDVFYNDGVAQGLADGRRRQFSEDQARIHELEAAKVDAAALVARLRAEAREATSQLAHVQSQLRDSQAETDALRKRVAELLLTERVPVASPPTLKMDASRHWRPEDDPVPRPALLLPPRPDIVAGAALSTNSNRMPKTLRQLQLLMSKAHQPGNEDALARVKILCTDAHNTPREHKTDMQRYILANWRNPDAPQGHTSSSYYPHHHSSSLHLGPNHSIGSTHGHGPNNPRADDPVEVWHAYLSVHQSSWPRGVRREADGSPRFDDLKASRTVARLRPTVGSDGDSNLRNEWVSVAVGMFAAPGMYRDLLRREGLVPAPGNLAVRRPYRVPEGGGAGIRIEEVVKHFAEAGVTVEEAEMELEPWAREYQAAASYPNNNDSKHSHQRSNNSKSNGRGPPPSSSSSHHRSSSSSYSRSKGSSRAYNRGEEERFGWR
ncbi:hypothetical protein MKEN_01061700 [Mycena kentingensis (nom. inval.)]|nr:hypothetical protein MKEN_01061700 [Mycena kentingensis (nom. inval.)]